MKTAISLPDELFNVADQLAKDKGMSRSELYATALREYVEGHRRDDLTERINRACSQIVDTALPADVAQAARSALLEAEW